MYMFKFTVEEAVGLSNIERYMKVIILFLLYIQFARLMRLVGEQKTGGRAMAAAAAAILLFAPVNALIEYIPRQQVDTIYAQQEPYISFANKAVGGDSGGKGGHPSAAGPEMQSLCTDCP